MIICRVLAPTLDHVSTSGYSWNLLVCSTINKECHSTGNLNVLIIMQQLNNFVTRDPVYIDKSMLHNGS